MDQFTLMAETLTNYNCKFVRNYIMEDEEATNESLALVESTLLHGYNISEPAEYKTLFKRVTLRTNDA
jgi:hypothetical protein